LTKTTLWMLAEQALAAILFVIAGWRIDAFKGKRSLSTRFGGAAVIRRAIINFALSVPFLGLFMYGLFCLPHGRTNQEEIAEGIVRTEDPLLYLSKIQAITVDQSKYKPGIYELAKRELRGVRELGDSAPILAMSEGPFAADMNQECGHRVQFITSKGDTVELRTLVKTPITESTLSRIKDYPGAKAIFGETKQGKLIFIFVDTKGLFLEHLLEKSLPSAQELARFAIKEYGLRIGYFVDAGQARYLYYKKGNKAVEKEGVFIPRRVVGIKARPQRVNKNMMNHQHISTNSGRVFRSIGLTILAGGACLVDHYALGGTVAKQAGILGGENLLGAAGLGLYVAASIVGVVALAAEGLQVVGGEGTERRTVSKQNVEALKEVTERGFVNQRVISLEVRVILAILARLRDPSATIQEILGAESRLPLSIAEIKEFLAGVKDQQQQDALEKAIKDIHAELLGQKLAGEAINAILTNDLLSTQLSEDFLGRLGNLVDVWEGGAVLIYQGSVSDNRFPLIKLLYGMGIRDLEQIERMWVTYAEAVMIKTRIQGYSLKEKFELTTSDLRIFLAYLYASQEEELQGMAGVLQERLGEAVRQYGKLLQQERAQRAPATAAPNITVRHNPYDRACTEDGRPLNIFEVAVLDQVISRHFPGLESITHSGAYAAEKKRAIGILVLLPRC
jgi:hypothetical protein